MSNWPLTPSPSRCNAHVHDTFQRTSPGYVPNARDGTGSRYCRHHDGGRPEPSRCRDLGYARISSTKQSLDRQFAALAEVGPGFADAGFLVLGVGSVES